MSFFIAFTPPLAAFLGWRLFSFLLNYSLLFFLLQQHQFHDYLFMTATRFECKYSENNFFLFSSSLTLFSSKLNLPWKKVVERYRTECIGMQSSFPPFFCCDMKTGCEGVKRESLKVLRRAELMCKQKKWQQLGVIVE